MGPYERQAFLINDRCAARSDRKGEWDDARHAQHPRRRQSRRPRSRPFRTAGLILFAQHRIATQALLQPDSRSNAAAFETRLPKFHV